MSGGGNAQVGPSVDRGNPVRGTCAGGGFCLLLRAFALAAEAQVDPWQLAIPIAELQELGLHSIDLAWLLIKGYGRQGLETTAPGDPCRSIRALQTSVVAPGAVFILTELGASTIGTGGLPLRHAELVRPIHAESPATTLPAPREEATTDRPNWDAVSRELRYRGRLVKRYRVPAANQERILSAFQEEEWPPSIDDPLPPSGEQDPKRRLQASIKSLNRNQIAQLIRFRGNGNGDRICWEPVTGS